MTSYRRSIATISLSPAVSEIEGDIGRKSQFFSHPSVFCTPLKAKGFPLELDIGAGDQEN